MEINMAVRKVRNTWWVDIHYDGQRFRKKSPENSKSGALAYEAVLRKKLANGEDINKRLDPKPNSETFKLFSETWFEIYVTPSTKPSVQRGYRQILNLHLIPAFGKLLLQDITTEKVAEYKAEKVKHLSPKTVNNHVAVLKKCLSTAHEWGRIDRVPKVTWLKVPQQKFDFLTSDESRVLVSSAADNQWRTFLLCAVRTGMRMGEIIGLKWEDIDLDARMINVRRAIVRKIETSPKNGKTRHVPISDDLWEALVSLGPKKGYVFRREGNAPVTRGMVWRALQTTLKRAGLRPIGVHVLRHTFASQLVMNGVSIRAVQEMLGHADLTMTMRYSHLSPSALHEAVACLQEAENGILPRFRQHSVNTRKMSDLIDAPDACTNTAISAKTSKKLTTR